MVQIMIKIVATQGTLNGVLIGFHFLRQSASLVANQLLLHPLSLFVCKDLD